MTSENINYKIVIETGQSGIDANVILCIFGDEETTTNLGLKTTKDDLDAKFEKDSILEFNVQAIDVGKIKKINIGHDGKGDEQQWFLKTIQIEKKDELYIFKANQLLNEEKAFIDLLPDETKASISSSALKKDQSNYKITIVTSSEENSGTDSGVLMTIFGDKDITKQFQLINDKENNKELFATGTTNEFEMELDDVGNINKINIGQDGKGLYQNWHLESVQIQKGTESYNFLANKMLDQSTSFIDLTPTQPRKTPTPSPTRLKTPTPEPEKIKSPSPEPTKTKSPSPEPVKIESSSPEPTKPKTPTPEPTKVKTPTPEPTKIKSPSPEPAKPKTPEPVKAKKPHSVMPEQKAPSTKETTYKILLQTGPNQEEGENSNLYLTIFGQNGQTKNIPLNENNKVNKKIPFKKNEKIDFELKTNDVGKISKILLNQDSNNQGIIWHINNLTIKRNHETTTFNIDRKFEQNTELEFTPSPLLKRTESPRKSMKTSETITKIVVKPKETDYDIIISTGDQAIEAPVILKIRGENGLINILLTKTKTGEKPFQSKSTQEFTQKTTDVGKIKRITIEHQGTDQNLLWHIQTIQIKKGNETYNFNANVRLDYKDNKVNLYPVGALFGHQREDYVQSELRRLRESLRTESAKLRPPPHKAYEPFVYNDLSPYFDTTPVERAIYSPLDAPPGYYTRFTALRVVEPWEAYEMDYGVSYKLLKQRQSRSISAKRSVSKSEDESIDRKQGSTHLPKFPCVSMQKPAEYSRPLTMNDVPKIRSFIRSRYTAQAESQIEKDYKRTHDDIYRMQLDNLTAYHESNRNNMVQVYHSYLENTPGSKKAVRELSAQVAVNNTKSSVQTTA